MALARRTHGDGMEIALSLLPWRIGGIVRNRWPGETPGGPGTGSRRAAGRVTVYAFDVAGDRITRIWATLNPGKLRPWTTG